MERFKTLLPLSVNTCTLAARAIQSYPIKGLSPLKYRKNSKISGKFFFVLEDREFIRDSDGI